MAADNTKINIINRALSEIKQKDITALTDQTEQARKANLFYDVARRATLRSCDWHFATVKQALAKLGDQDTALSNPTIIADQDVLPQWSYLYAMPASCLRVRKIFNSANPITYNPYRTDIVGENIGMGVDLMHFEVARSPVTNVMALGSNLEKAWIEFTFDIVDESQFDDLFAEAFSLQLAYIMCMPLTADKELKQLVKVDLDDKMGEAKRKNGGEGTEMGPRSSNYEKARDY